MKARTVVGGLAFVVLILSGIVHFLTYRDIDLSDRYPAIWTLFPAAIGIFIFTTIYLALQIGARPAIGVTYRATLALMPRWTWAVLLIGLVYILATPFLSGFVLAIPGLVDGKYILNDHGRITEYTIEQVRLMRIYQLREESAFWMWLMLCSSLYLLTARTPSEARESKPVNKNGAWTDD